MQKPNFVRRTLLKAIVSAMALGSASVAMAEVNMAGKTVDWVIPFSEGGGSDKWARFYAPLLSEQLPGKPNVVVKNMPGAGSTKGANWFASRAKNDGLTILGTSGSTQFPYLLGDKRVKFDYADWNVVLASATGGVAYLPADLAAKWKQDPKSIMDTNFVFGSQGATRLDLIPLLAWTMLGLKVDPVFGIKGRGDGRLMFERGEANIDYQTSGAFLSKVMPLVKEGKAVPIMTWGALDANGEIVRDPTFPDIPTFKEVYTQVKGEAPSGEAWDAWKAFFVAGFPAQKMVFLPKGTDQEIIDTYSNAFKAVTSQPDFPEKAKKRLGVYEQATGAKADAFKKLGTEVAPNTKAWIKKWLKDRYGVNL
ncbi:Bug family tripartite tricarboxylate transporter substrate binding protein [Leucothrix pacifica]|uniref:Tricarboxylate transporter n=1 Tax=Leucothrix pacifica TaxID=1247513 RepID=A0A317CGP4_9GAMM|nr:tricarboxylate transporter [Leucothrix pacifica]PWQ97754.1 tricarboxylate transporter [Leucothrix pacifica]